MAFYDTTWYLNSVGWTAVTAWAANTAYTVGQLRRQLAAPTVGNERVFVCIVAGTSHLTTEPTWTVTRGAKTTDNTVTWQECTGASAVNGDLTNTSNWTTAKATGTPTLGAIIQRNSGASYQICTTAGTMAASEPAFSDTAGVTTNDGTSVWTSLGLVGTYTGGQAPFARIVASVASSWFVAGNTIYVGSDHSESQAATISIVPTIAVTSFGRVLCHNRGAYPPLAANLTTGAVVATDSGGANILFFPTGVGTMYFRGVSFKAGVGGSAGNITIGTGNQYLMFDNCTLELSNTSASGLISMGGGTMQSVVLENTKVKFGDVGQRISMASGNFFWRNTGQILVSGSSIPTNFMLTNSNQGPCILEGLDLSQLSGTLFQLAAGTYGYYVVKDCKLHASVTLSTPAGPTQQMQYIRSDSALGYTSSRYTYEGTETTETSITRVGGSVDPAGQAQSRKAVTTANVQFLRPFRMQPMAVWNPTIAGTVTATVRGTINSAVLPNNDEIWLEVEYLGTSGSPLGVTASTGKVNVLSTAVPVTADGSSWNGGGSGAGWSPFKLSVSLDVTNNPQPQFAGYFTVRVKAAKASTTYYIDPQVVLS